MAKSIDVMDPTTREKLVQFIQRIERLEEEKAVIMAGMKDVYGEAKHFGYDPKHIRKVVALRKKEKHVLEEEEQILGLYRDAVGV